VIEISKAYIETTSSWENKPPIIPKLIDRIEGFGRGLPGREKGDLESAS